MADVDRGPAVYKNLRIKTTQQPPKPDAFRPNQLPPPRKLFMLKGSERFEVENYAQDRKLTLIYLLCNDHEVTITVSSFEDELETYWTAP